MYVGTMGERGSGKSEVGRMLRVLAGSSPAADLEYSDLMMEVVNRSLATVTRDPDGFVWQLIADARTVTGERLPARPVSWFNAERADVQQALTAWLAGPASSPDVRVTRANKLSDGHVPPLVWLGVFMRHEAYGGPGIWARTMDRRVAAASGEPLITLSGVRFPEDPAPICDRGGIIIDVLRYAVTRDTDPTNQHRQKIQADVVLNNHGTLAELSDTVSQLYADLSSGRSLHRSSGVPHVYGRPHDVAPGNP